MKHQSGLPMNKDEPTIPPTPSSTPVVIVSPTPDNPIVQRDQLIRERGRQHALDQWKQQNSVKQVSAPPSQSHKKAEGDNITVISALSEQSSFTAETKNVNARPKATKLIITDLSESDSNAEEEKNRRLQKFEMIKRKKANEAAEREKVCTLAVI
jgi:hypothetical protein